jgi:hypothetical protein
VKNEATNSDLKEAVVFLNLETFVRLDELCKEFYAIKPTLALFVNEEFLLKERDVLEKAKSTRKCFFLIPKNEPHLTK